MAAIFQVFSMAHLISDDNMAEEEALSETWNRNRSNHVDMFKDGDTLLYKGLYLNINKNLLYADLR